MHQWTLKAIRTQDFRLLREAELAFDAPGLLLVSAENHDIPNCNSNQSGKSTLLHALTWALYECDTLGTRITNSAVHADADACHVKVAFADDDGNTIEVVRSRRKKPKPDVPTVTLKVVRGDQKWYGAAEQIQKHVDAAFGRKELFLAAHIFGYDEAYVPFARKPDGDKRSLFDLLISSEDLDLALQAAVDGRKGIERKQERYQRLASYMNGRRRALRPELERALRENQDELCKLENELATERALLEAEEHQIQLIKNELQERIDARKRVEAYIREKEDALKQMKAEQAKAAEEETYWIGREQKARAKKSTCPMCGSVLDTAGREKMLKEAAEKAAEARTAKERAKAKMNALVNECGSKVDEARATLVALSSREDYLRVCLSERETARGRIEGACGMRKTRIETLKRQEGNAQELRRALVQADTMAGTLAELQADAQELIQTYRFWEQGFGRSGIRSRRLDRITPRLNELAMGYSNELFGDGTHVKYSTQTQNKNGEYRDRFALYVEDPDGETVEVLSAGQAMRRDIVHMFSVMQLADELGKRSVRFLAFDEAFRTLDARGKDAVMRLLQEQLIDTPTILVIEHDDEMKAQFDASILVTRKENRSSLSFAQD